MARAVRSRSANPSPPEVCFSAFPPRIDAIRVSAITARMMIASTSATSEIRNSGGRMS